MATEILAEEYSKEIYLEFIKTMKNMIDGQIMEIGGTVKDLETYFSYVDKKTSSLFAMSVKIPLMYYGIERDDLVKSARDFGTVFQMINDMSGKKEVGILDFLPPADAAMIIRNRLEELKSCPVPIKKNLESLKIF